MNNNEKAGAYIRNVRTDKGKTLSQSAKDLGISLMYLSEIERGLKTPSNVVLDNIEKYFGIEYGKLFDMYGRAPQSAIEEVESDDTLKEVLLQVHNNKKFSKEDKRRLYDGLRELYRELDKD